MGKLDVTDLELMENDHCYLKTDSVSATVESGRKHKHA